MFDSDYIEQLTSELLARLPELSWKITALNSSAFYQSLPKKLFRTLQVSPAQCIEELKQDIYFLAQQKPSLSAHYLAQQIERKIDVLVGICKIQQNQPVAASPAFSMTMLSTRHQWLRRMEEEVEVLTQQQQALIATLAQRKKAHADPELILNVHAELGKIEQKLTLAQERLGKGHST